MHDDHAAPTPTQPQAEAGATLTHPTAPAWQRYRDQGVVLIGIPFEDRADAPRAFARQLDMTWPLLVDPGSRTALRYGVYGPPETFVIGPGGRVAFKQVGPVSYGVLSD